MMMSYCTRFLLLLVATLLLASTSLADTLQGRVVGIADGDTVTVVADANLTHLPGFH